MVRGGKKKIGEWGENLACAFLCHRGFKIIERNYYTTVGEIDIVAKLGDDFYFEIYAWLSDTEKRFQAGEYELTPAMNIPQIVGILISGKAISQEVRVTVPEGVTFKEIVSRFENSGFKIGDDLPKAGDYKDEFSFLADSPDDASLEGFLFPDTYFFNASANTDEVIRVMSTEFKKKIEPWTPFIEASGHTEREIIIMASIIEKEAKTEEDQALVSGILWKRIEKGIPLQVDAPFYYLLGKTSSELTQTDLAMKSAYNTYKNKGLPAGPIGNPGISTIRAAIKPKESPYLYYLSDEKGILHYARTFDEHKVNKTKYIK